MELQVFEEDDGAGVHRGSMTRDRREPRGHHLRRMGGKLLDPHPLRSQSVY
ncbi:hypothetical protein DsansV1_C29g0211611 [Dioscorea sansibarensis]